MNRSLFVLTALTLPLFGCAGDDGNQETDSATSQGSISITITGSTSASSTTTAGTDTTSATEGTGSESDSSTGEPECVVDEDCASDSFVCKDGVCEFDPTKCGEAVIDIPISTPNMMLVVDKSGSMVANKWDGDADPNTDPVTRWFSLYQVVEFIATNFNASINLGMQLYPSLKAKTEYNNNACLVEMAPEVPVAPENGAKVLGALPPASAMAQISGGTPSRLGLQAAINHLDGLNDGLPKFIAFITDGAANCSPEGAEPLDTQLLFETYDDQVLTAVQDAVSKGIGVFVVGIDTPNLISDAKPDGNPDSTNPFEKLNELAIAGGFPKNDPNEQFYNAQNQIELQAALSAIAMQVLPCVIDLNPPPAFPDYVEVTVNGVLYQKPLAGPEECGSMDGWYYSTPEQNQITLCGAACSEFQMSGKIDAKYKCPGSG
jgi:hypothetical protein